jgi:hypothetical protein
MVRIGFSSPSSEESNVMVLIPQKDNGCRITVFVHQRDEALIEAIEKARDVRRPRQFGEGEMIDRRSRSAVILEALKIHFGLIPDPRTPHTSAD